MPTKTEDLAVTWSAFTSGLTYDDLLDHIRQVTKWLVLDNFGTTLAANTLGIGIPELLTWARGAGGAPEATLLGFTDKLPAVTAAMVNGGTLGSGERLSARVDAARGHRDNPLTTEQRRRKFADCAAHAAADLSDATLREVMDMIDHLEDVPDVRAFPRLLGGKRG